MFFFGVDDDKRIVGFEAVQDDAESISRLIKDRITPLPQIELSAFKENGRDILCLKVLPSCSTPYYYRVDGIMEAYIRAGNESIVVPDYQ